MQVKRFLSVVLSLCMLSATVCDCVPDITQTITAQAAEADYSNEATSEFTLRGDVNNDGEINDNDSTLLNQWLVSLVGDNELNLANADVNIDGNVDIIDLVDLIKLCNQNSASTFTLKGDVNGDGVVNSDDKDLLHRWLVSLVSDNELNLENADVNIDGKVDIIDLIELIRLYTKPGSSAEETIEQHIGEDSEILSEINTEENAFKVSLDITASGEALASLTASESEFSSIIESDMVVGVVPEFECEEGTTVEDVALNFKVEESFTENTNGNYAAVSKDFEGIKRFNVFKYFDDIGMLLPVETTYDTENNRITTHVDELGTYCLVDMEQWFEALGVEPSDLETLTDSSNNKRLLTSAASPASKNEKISNKNIDIVLNLFLNTSSSDSIATQALNLGSYIFDSCDESCSVNIYVVGYNGSPMKFPGKDRFYAENTAELKTIIDNGILKRKTAKLPLLEDSVTKFLNNYQLRENADKYYVVVESDDVRSNNLSLVKTRMTEADICAIVVTNKNMGDHASLAYETFGQYSDQIFKYSEPIYNFIIDSLKKKSEENAYRTLVATGWKQITLDKPITNEYKTMLDDQTKADEFDFSDREKFADTDGDGLIDLREIRYSFNGTDVVYWDENGEVVLPTLKDIIDHKAAGKKYVKNALSQYTCLDIAALQDVRVLPVWSDPTEADTDYDFITDDSDLYPLSPCFSGTMSDSYAENYKIDFKVDYSAFFGNNYAYNKDLAVFGSILSNLAYIHEDLSEGIKTTSINIDSGANLSNAGIHDVYNCFGLQDYEDYELSKHGYDDDDISQMFLGHKQVKYKDDTKEIVVVSVRGTDGTIEEWSSNFDVGAETDDYLDRNNEYWRNKKNHKGFDVAANRLYDHIIEYIDSNLDKNSEKAIYIVGHSRGAAIANILGTKFDESSGIKAFVYTYATPNTVEVEHNEFGFITDRSYIDNYKYINNIVNDDDLVPMLPLESWYFRKYGNTYSASIENSYENKYGRRQKETWERLFGKDYNYNNNLSNTIDAMTEIADDRAALYRFTYNEDTVYNYYNGLNESQIAEEKAKRIEKYGYRISRYCEVLARKRSESSPENANEYTDRIYDIISYQTPAAFMMILADLTANYQHNQEDLIVKYNKDHSNDEDVYHFMFQSKNVGFYVASKYTNAKLQFIKSARDTSEEGDTLRLGGMVNGHMGGTYYFLASDYYNKLKKQ